MIEVQQINSSREFDALLRTITEELYPVSHVPFTLSNGGATENLLIGLVAYENHQPKACLQLYHHPLIQHNQHTTVQLGNYECINSFHVSGALLEYALNHARHLGYEYAIGPMNGSTWYNYRFKIDNNSPNFFLEPFHQNYYIEQYKRCGFETVAGYTSTIDHHLTAEKASLSRIEDILNRKEIVFRNIDMEHIETELKQVHDLSLRAFKNNPYFAPLSWSDFWKKNKTLIDKIDPNLFMVASHEEKIIAYIFTIHNLWEQNTKQAVLKTLAVSPEITYRGTGFVLMEKLNDYLKKNGYSSMIHAFMFENNNVIRLSQKFSRDVLSKYILLGRKI